MRELLIVLTDHSPEGLDLGCERGVPHQRKVLDAGVDLATVDPVAQPGDDPVALGVRTAPEDPGQPSPEQRERALVPATGDK